MAAIERRQVVTRSDLEVEWVPIDKLRQHPENPRAADPDNIIPSLKAHGQFRALIISRDGFLLAGNHTYQGALALREDPKYARWRKENRGLTEGLAELAVHRMPFDHNTPQAIEVMLADNRSSDFSRYDDGQLATLLVRLSQEGGEEALQAAAWEANDVSRVLERIQAAGFLGDIAGGDEINKLMHGAATNLTSTQAFSLPVTRVERDEIMELLGQVKESYEAPTLAQALLIALRLVAKHKIRPKHRSD